MLITRIELQSEAQPGRTITLEREGKSVLIGGRDSISEGPIEVYDPRASKDRRFDIADTLAAEIYGRTSGGMAKATNSMIHDCWDLLKQVAGE